MEEATQDPFDGKKELVEGTEVKPTTTQGNSAEEILVRDWEDRDMKAIATICMSLSRGLMMKADIDNGAAALWTWL